LTAIAKRIIDNVCSFVGKDLFVQNNNNCAFKVSEAMNLKKAAQNKANNGAETNIVSRTNAGQSSLRLTHKLHGI